MSTITHCKSKVYIPDEQTPLLPKSLIDDVPSYPNFNIWWSEFCLLVKSSTPVVLTYMLQNSIQLASIFSLGHLVSFLLGLIQLAVAALANMFASVTCWSVSIGISTALDTLGSQAYTGSNDPHALGVYLQRAIGIMSIIFVPISFLWWNAEYLLLWLRQDPELAALAGQFLRYLLPGAFPFVCFECVKRYLQAQGIMHASTYVLLIASPLNALTNYLFVWREPFKLGFIGAPLATSCTYGIMLLLLVLYVKFVAGGDAWGGWSRKALQGWLPFLKLAFPGTIMICCEWWAFQVSGLAAAYFGTVALAAQSILLTSSSLCFTIPMGISIASSNRVGNLLGSGRPNHAKLAAYCSLILAFLFGSLNSTVLFSLRNVWGYLFNDDEKVVSLVAQVLPISAMFQIFDGLGGVTGGVLRGQGKQEIGAYVNIAAYYLIALPIGYWLVFVRDGSLPGIWSAFLIALFGVSVGQLTSILRTNWIEEVRKSKERVKIESDSETL
ncbi:MATE efflux family protein [Basidiobolus meristosporus CBS 931.73]|uniref:MATE efflux family protein n=1 Tax=Basidiobolus meristosporus CBS 931.73 TaxID=1314790 RepID=A0A1Y1X714_9FUNG|nr:MATE efflux family protein [Basidiobolus meristosporus CBS 931.73]|eukprot:ORX81186.1 MATE efflux family protein [Basidiobolus meristosporus CBS 931.73]